MDDNASIAASADTEISSFWQIIPYRSKQLCIESSVQHYPFWATTSESTTTRKSKNIRDHDAVAALMALISLFSTITQIIFFISAPSPYRWISFGFLLCCQLFHMLVAFTYLIAAERDDRCWYRLLLTVQIFIAPILPFTWIHLVSVLNRNPDTRTPYNSLLMKALLSISTGILQSVPHLFVLVAMMVNQHVNLTESPYLLWSLIATVLSVASCCVIFASVFQNQLNFLMNVIFVMLDVMLVVFVFSLLAHGRDVNGTVFVIFYVDIALFSAAVPLMVLDITLFVLKLLNQEADQDFMVNCFASCCVGGILATVLPVFIVLYVFNIFVFSLLEQTFNWSLFPYNTRLLKTSTMYSFYDWIIHHWILKAPDVRERNLRLCIANMVIMDTGKLKTEKYHELKQIIGANIRRSMHDFSDECVQHMSSENKFKFNVETDFDPQKSDQVLLNKCWKWTFWLYAIGRLFHLLSPIIILILMYTPNNVTIRSNQVTLFAMYAMAALLALSVVCFLVAYYTMYYYRMIFCISKETDLEETKVFIANCHAQIGVLRALIEWTQDCGGNKDIARVIFQCCYGNEESDHDDGNADQVTLVSSAQDDDDEQKEQDAQTQNL